MRISVIFRGTGKRISPVEEAAYHKNVDVFFQENAWADQKFCMEWAQRPNRKNLMRGRGHLPQERPILLMDNLHAQTTDAFKEFLSEHCNTLASYFPANNTDEVQPVDAGVGRMLKVEVGKQLDIWLGQADNLEKWESNKLTASDRRVLITQWVGPAMNIVDNRPDYRFRLFEKCGMAMTVDGSGDERITLEGLNKPYDTALWTPKTPATTKKPPRLAAMTTRALGTGELTWGVGATVTTAGNAWRTTIPAMKTTTASLISAR